jgi:8-oxo-dGTP pyrophosphatase MutT (NUDIX family)
VTVNQWTYCAVCGERLVASPDPTLNPACPACGWFRPTYALPVVLVLAHTGDGRIVYTRKRDWPAGAWGLVAGFIDVGETAEVAALRELREETGLVGGDARVLRTMSRTDQLLVCVDVAVDGVPVASSDVDEVLLTAPDLNLTPEAWQARELVAAFIAGR